MTCNQSTVWNSLPASLQDIRDQQGFKRNLKTELFSRHAYVI